MLLHKSVQNSVQSPGLLMCKEKELDKTISVKYEETKKYKMQSSRGFHLFMNQKIKAI